MSMKRILSGLAVIAVVAAGVLTATIVTSVHTATASPPVTSYYWTFNKGSDHTKSRLQLRAKTGSVIRTIWSIRAGSGNNPGSHHTCKINHGWLPNGWYDITHRYKDKKTGVIRGPALQLSNHRCHDGTWRTELFIHSSYPWSASHYNSNGCIKVSNSGGPHHASGHIETVYKKTVHYAITHVHVVS